MYLSQQGFFLQQSLCDKLTSKDKCVTPGVHYCVAEFRHIYPHRCCLRSILSPIICHLFPCIQIFQLKFLYLFPSPISAHHLAHLRLHVFNQPKFDVCLTVRRWHKWSRWPTRCNSKNLLIFRLAHHVLSNSFPILRSARLWFTACGIMSPDSCLSEARTAAARTVCSVWRMLLRSVWRMLFEQHPSHRTQSLPP